MAEKFQLNGLFWSDNLEKSEQDHLKFKLDVVSSNKKEGKTNEISLSLDLINVKDGNKFYAGVSMSVFVLVCF